ncbi:hypothetical protein ACFYNM_10415 [Streptomyces spororaveus]|uniref:hypothetical protein n=1 Tax=Streptomyces spororaveus TaxID=284039 RepID=UPI003695F8A0
MTPAQLPEEQPPKVVTRHRDGLIHAYVLDPHTLGAVEPAAVFRPRAGDEAEEEWFRHHLVDGRTRR